MQNLNEVKAIIVPILLFINKKDHLYNIETKLKQKKPKY